MVESEALALNDELINDIIHADDAVLLSESAGHQRVIDNVVEECYEYGLKLNRKATKVIIMILHRNE